jgi:hypothetical protein
MEMPESTDVKFTLVKSEERPASNDSQLEPLIDPVQDVQREAPASPRQQAAKRKRSEHGDDIEGERQPTTKEEEKEGVPSKKTKVPQAQMTWRKYALPGLRHNQRLSAIAQMLHEEKEFEIS